MSSTVVQIYGYCERDNRPVPSRQLISFNKSCNWSISFTCVYLNICSNSGTSFISLYNLLRIESTSHMHTLYLCYLDRWSASELSVTGQLTASLDIVIAPIRVERASSRCTATFVSTLNHKCTHSTCAINALMHYEHPLENTALESVSLSVKVHKTHTLWHHRQKMSKCALNDNDQFGV